MEEEMGKENGEDKEIPNNSNSNSENPKKKKAKSCKGCLYYSSSFKSNSRNPLCVGITRSLPQAPHYIVGESEMEASRDGRSFADFKYACVGYSVYSNGKVSSADVKETQTELPVCVGLEGREQRSKSRDEEREQVERRRERTREQRRRREQRRESNSEQKISSIPSGSIDQLSGSIDYQVRSETKSIDVFIRFHQRRRRRRSINYQVLVDRRVNTADPVPAHVHTKEDTRGFPQPRTHKPAHSVGDEFLGRFSRNATVVAMGVAKNLRRVGNQVKERLDDILYPYRRRPK